MERRLCEQHTTPATAIKTNVHLATQFNRRQTSMAAGSLSGLALNVIGFAAAMLWIRFPFLPVPLDDLFPNPRKWDDIDSEY